jgi:hypothetical protein
MDSELTPQVAGRFAAPGRRSRAMLTRWATG